MAIKNINIKFPIEDDTEKNSFFQMNQITKDALTSNLLLLLLTEKGQRYYMPDYGTDLVKFIFEPNDNETLSEIEADIRETVKKYIPELTIQKISYLNDEENNDHQLKILVDFIYSESVFNDIGRVELTF